MDISAKPRVIRKVGIVCGTPIRARLHKGKVRVTRLLFLAVLLMLVLPAAAFPPYRSTDADTGDPYTLELRLGLVKADREDGETEVAAPLLRANFGLPNKIELISEFEYLPEEDEFGDGAAGIKWIPLFGSEFSFGVETLVLLPIRPGDDGLGVEAQLLTTFWRERFRLHVNAGWVHDARVSPSVDGWRASLLAEFPREGYRPGIELFAKDVENKSTDVRAGVGIIYDIGSFDIRTGLHVGLTDEAPDFSFSLWITTKLPFQ